MKYTIEMTWNDETTTYFQVETEGEKHHIIGVLMWVTRGVLMASSAKRAVAYNEEGYDIVSYIK